MIQKYCIAGNAVIVWAIFSLRTNIIGDGYFKTLDSTWISPHPHSLFSKNLNGHLLGWNLDGPLNVLAKFDVCIAALYPFFEIIAVKVLCGGCEPPICLEEEVAVGWQGLYSLKERWLVTSYRLSIVTFPPSLRGSEIGLSPIAAFVLQHSTFSNRRLVSRCFPGSRWMLGVGGWRLGYEERRCWTNCAYTVQLVSKIFNLVCSLKRFYAFLPLRVI